jgi:23S rRNA (cytidine1920-2'-O)/16S rRNA (cytidine1409-2'-O)-methyltransferase
VTGEKRRLDQAMVARGLAESRAKAQAAILAGGVVVNGAPAVKPGVLVDDGAQIEATPAHSFVSRGGVKLAAALDAFDVCPAGRTCLDLGASTGGFSDALLRRGAFHVTAVDVGRDQLHASLRREPRLTLLEGKDARTLSLDDCPAGPPDLIVCDASFIALGQLLPVPLALAAARADLIALIKPQFEAGKNAARDKRGLLADDLARAVISAAAAGLDGLGEFRQRAVMESPIRGGEGALEGLAHFRRGG